MIENLRRVAKGTNVSEMQQKSLVILDDENITTVEAKMNRTETTCLIRSACKQGI